MLERDEQGALTARPAARCVLSEGRPPETVELTDKLRQPGSDLAGQRPAHPLPVEHETFLRQPGDLFLRARCGRCARGRVFRLRARLLSAGLFQHREYPQARHALHPFS
jgi:hypothetical protein